MPPAIAIDCPKSSDTGAYRLSWTCASPAKAEPGTAAPLMTAGAAADGPRFLLEENGAQLYQGPHRATSVSGRPAGDYSYRVGLLGSEGAGRAGERAAVTVVGSVAAKLVSRAIVRGVRAVSQPLEPQ